MGRTRTKTRPGKVGRRPAELTKRFTMRCQPEEFELWEEHARAMGFGGAAPWLRRLASEALTKPG